MSARDAVTAFVSIATDAAARFKTGAEERQQQGTTTNDSGRSPANSTEKGRWTLFSASGDALDVSPSDDSRQQDRDGTQPTDARDNVSDRQNSTRTTDLRQLDGHESWKGVYDLNESDDWGHE